MNKMRRSRGAESEIATSVKQSPGVYGKGGGPGFESFPQSQGSSTIVTKTAETSMGTAKETVNQLRGSSNDIRMGQAGKKATSSTIKRRASQYRRSVGTEGIKGKY